MMAQDKVTSHYEVTIVFTFKEKNSYGDDLAGGYLEYTKKLKANSLGELAQVLIGVEALGKVG